AHSAAALSDQVERMWTDSDREPVHLVAHSMGGLLVRTALMLHGDRIWPKIGRIVFVGTPHAGSMAIGGSLKTPSGGFGLIAILGRSLGRATFRSPRGVLSLPPAPRGVYPGTRGGDDPQWGTDRHADAYLHPCANFDLYDAGAWGLGLDPE